MTLNRLLHGGTVCAVALALVAALVTPTPADARDVKGAAKTNVNSSANRNTNVNKNTNVNRNTNVNKNTNVNRNTNVNVDRNVNIDVDHNHCCDNDWDDHHHPIATGVAIGAAAAVTSAVIGSMVYSLPPACTTTVINGVGYSNCGGTWYQPQYVGTSVQYVVVTQPR